jgi:alcohol dehydrogenase class IV
MNMLPTITYLTDIHFAEGAAAQLPAIVGRYGITKPLIVTDAGLRRAGLIDAIAPPGSTIFDAVDSNPTEANVLAGRENFQQNECDGVIAIGGGSPIDAAKCIALLATHAVPLRQYAFVENGAAKITGKKPPVIAVPTTAGTGSEVGRGALVTLGDGDKLALLSPHLIPQAAVCDPRLTVGLPPMLTAGTGMDAISHCIETYLSPKFNPVAEAIALDGLGRGLRNICRAVAHGDDLAARSEMLMSALQGGLCFQKGLGVIHSMTHALGALTAADPSRPLHHGTLNAICLPHALRFNAEAAPEKMRVLARVAGVSSPRDLPFFFVNLSRSIGLPTRLGELGVTSADVAAVMPGAMRDHCHLTNPRAVGEAEMRGLFEVAM